MKIEQSSSPINFKYILDALIRASQAAKTYGTPILTVPRAENIGFPGRRENLHSIYEEGKRLMSVSEILITDQEEESWYLDVFNTVAAAPHTAFVIKYEEFKRIWREKLEKTDYASKEGKEYIIGDEQQGKSCPDFVPTNFLTWVFLRKQTKEKVELIPIDLFDLIGIVDSNSLARERFFALFQGKISEEVLNQVIVRVYQEINQRIKIVGEVLLSLYNEKIIPQLNSQLKREFLGNNFSFRQKTSEDVATYMGIGYYRGEEQYKKDGKGKGPQSHPAFHIHTAIFPDLDEIKNLCQEDPAKLHQILSVLNNCSNFKGSLSFIDPEKISPELFVKQVDPYSSIFFQIMRDWVAEKLEEQLNQFNPEIKTFIHHSDSERLDQRFAEGWKITVEGDKFVDIMKGMGPFFKEIYNLWQEAEKTFKDWFVYQREDRLLELKQKYSLSDEMIEALKKLLPTDEQLTNWKDEIDKTGVTSQRIKNEIERRKAFKSESKSERKKNRRIDFLILQVLQEFNQGYNIPGMPSFGISWYLNQEGKTVFYISPLLSTKGVAEQYLGAPLQRQSA